MRIISGLPSLALAVFSAGIAWSQTPPRPAVTVAPAEITEVRESAGFTGRVSAIQKVDIRARISGFLEEVGFKEGDTVGQGAVLFRIQDSDYQAAVTEIEGEIMAAEADRRLAQLERDRKAELVRRQAVAQNDLDVAEAQLGKAEGALTRLSGTLARQKLELSYTQVTAPFGGITGLANVDVGALVSPDTGPLTTLTLLDPIEVTFPVATSLVLDYQARVQKGEVSHEAVVTLTLPNGVAYPEAGDIDYVAADVAQGTDTILLRARFDNPQGTLRDGALVSVALSQRTPTKVLTVPQQSVQRDQQGAFVLVVGADSKVELRRVEAGMTTGGRTVITGGLAEGETVVTDGVNKARPGVVVDAAVATNG